MSETTLTYKSHLFDENNSRVKEQQELFYYYTGQHTEVLKSLQAIQDISFTSDKVQFSLQQAYFSLTEKIVNQLAIVYKQPATRNIIKGEESNEELTTQYNNLLPTDINTIDKMAHRYAKLCNTSLTRVDFINDKIYYDVQSSHLFSVLVDNDDPYKMTALSYPKTFINNSGEYELFHVVWTNDSHYKVPNLQIETITSKQVLKVPGDAQAIGDNTKMINPYGIIPYAVCRLKKQGDFWGNGLTDVVTCSGQINFLLSDMINTAIMQAWGQLVLINADFEKTAKDGKVRIGVNYPLNMSTQNSEVHPDAKFINANPMLKEVMEIIDWMIKMLALSKGLNPNSFLALVQATSGYSKIIDAMEQMEVRQDDIEPCRIYEDNRFEITQAVLAHNKTLSETDAEIPDLDETFLEVKFADIEIPKTPDEQQKEDEFKLSKNFISYLDVMKRDYPDLTEEELEAKLEANKEINERFKNVVPALVPFSGNGQAIEENVNGVKE